MRGGAFRGVVKSLVIVTGLIIIVLNASIGLFFARDEFTADILRFLTYVLLGSLLVGGIALVTSWRREAPYDPE
jgi:hypothetical protein